MTNEGTQGVSQHLLKFHTALNVKIRSLKVLVQESAGNRADVLWWKQHVEEFLHLTRMTRQYLTVVVTSTSPERLFSSVGFVKSDLWGH
jgi:hypothetical protein